jgi:hypothetical protein
MQRLTQLEWHNSIIPVKRKENNKYAQNTMGGGTTGI